MINRPVLMKIHVLIAVFVMPVAIMFFVTGALYTWGVKGGYETTVQKLSLNAPLQKELSYLLNIAEKELNKRGISIPKGKAKIKKSGKSFRLEWTGVSTIVVLKTTSNPLVAKLKIKNASWHRHFVQLHKAKGGTAFKVYATILAVGMLFLIISGFIMAWQLPRLRQMTLISTILGLVFFVAMFISS